MLVLTAVSKQLENHVLQVQSWSIRLFAKFSEENDVRISELICHVMTRETLKPLMLKALACLAGRPFDQVRHYMNASHECGEWLTDFDRDLEFLEIDETGHTMIAPSAALALGRI